MKKQIGLSVTPSVRCADAFMQRGTRMVSFLMQRSAKFFENISVYIISYNIRNSNGAEVNFLNLFVWHDLSYGV